jgi:hypothetical protein
VDVHLAGCGNGPRDEEQRVTREKGCQYEPGLAKYNEEEDRVDPRAVVGDQPLKVPVEVKNDVEQGGEELHERSVLDNRSGFVGLSHRLRFGKIFA